MPPHHPQADAAASAGTDVLSVPSGAPSWVTKELISQTIRVWQPYYCEPLTADDALVIIQSASQLFEVLSSEPEL
jgi:hypothetical protein